MFCRSTRGDGEVFRKTDGGLTKCQTNGEVVRCVLNKQRVCIQVYTTWEVAVLRAGDGRVVLCIFQKRKKVFKGSKTKAVWSLQSIICVCLQLQQGNQCVMLEKGLGACSKKMVTFPFKKSKLLSLFSSIVDFEIPSR